MALLIAFNASAINADERAREHATMFAYGVTVGRVVRGGVVEAMLIGALGTPPGSPPATRCCRGSPQPRSTAPWASVSTILIVVRDALDPVAHKPRQRDDALHLHGLAMAMTIRLHRRAAARSSCARRFRARPSHPDV